MDLITLDFETYYDKEYSLKKLTMEEYIRHPKFEVIGVGVKINNEQTEWASGSNKEIKEYLQGFDWENSMVIAHNTLFDGAILNWCYDIDPRGLADTLCMSRALHGVDTSASLQALTERYGIGKKGTEVIEAQGKRRVDFTAEELARYGDYCVNDVELTYKLFSIFISAGFPKQELRVIDMTLRMFTNPMLEVDNDLLHKHLTTIKNNKETLLISSGIDKKDLMSNKKFAEVLETFGVEPPKKISLTTGKETFAFAKSDEQFISLLEHPNEEVKNLVEARLGIKSTLEETRTQRFIDIGSRGKLPIPVRYYAAHTGRWGGDDKINIQNLPSRGPNAKKLKSSILAPDGYKLIDADSSQIEARVLSWLAGQDDLTNSFTRGEDVYKNMASIIYSVPEEDVTKEQRFVGKTTILGAGYGMGSIKFQAQLKTNGFDMDLDEARRVINVYRETNWKINQLWRDCQNMLRYMVNGDNYNIATHLDGVIQVLPKDKAILLPSNLLLRYDQLKAQPTDKGVEYMYKTRMGYIKIYGGKVVENLCQALARCIIAEQMLQIRKKYTIVLTVHDSIVACVREEETEEAKRYIEACMRQAPYWAKGLPLDCESGIGKNYGECG
jgi:DNA polymerase I-like protein with 3'-5' exonuclease and polymerase domains